MEFVGFIVCWTLLGYKGPDGPARSRVFSTFAEAIAHCQVLVPMQGESLTRVTLQRVQHAMDHDQSMVSCPLCDAIWDALDDGQGEGPTCGVCDAVGHDTNNCRSGDAPYDYREDYMMEGGLYGM